MKITLTQNSRINSVDFSNLEFGKNISDHMLVAIFENGTWGEPEIMPFGDLNLSPAMLSLHYGQSVFEGMKAFRMADGAINIFRPGRHLDRFNRSLDRMCMPSVPQELFLGGLEELIRVDQKWVPSNDGASLYLRPFCFASESRLGVNIAKKYHFIILTSPAGLYQPKPYRLKVETHYARTVEGGTGFAKCAGNYGGAYYPTRIAVQEGYDQVLWTDGKEHQYVDEVGMMNVMFMINGVLTTPQLNTAILDGITRDSILTLARDMGISVEERRIKVSELENAFKSNTLSEAFGTGTAAVVAPIATININGTDYSVREPGIDSFQNKVKAILKDIRLGVLPDKHRWNHPITGN